MDFVQLKRGIRQGNPLSPFLFVIYAKGLSTLLDARETHGRIKGIKVCNDAPSINHLLFADDSFIFARSTLQECYELKNLLQTYELASGQAVNLSKSCVAFSVNVNEVDTQVLSDFLGMTQVNYHDRYLGIPVCTSKSKKQRFAYIKDQL